jgi:hypothetical protein
MTRKNLIISLLFAFSTPAFAQTPDLSLIPYRQGNLWGYAAPDKSIVIKPQFEDAKLFQEGFAAVKKAGKYGYIDKTGKLVIPAKYFVAKPFRFGFYAASGKVTEPGDGQLNPQKTVLFAGVAPAANGYEICIDTKGKQLVKCPAIADNSAPDVNKPNTVTIISNYSTIRKTDLYDKILDDYKMPGAEDSYYIAIRNNKVGVFNKTFDVIVPFEYDSIKKLNMGAMPYLIVAKDGLKGILFGNGSNYMAVENTRLDYVKADDDMNYLIFTKDGKTGLKNSKYKIIAEPIYNDIVFEKNDGFVITGNDGKKGFIFLNGAILDPKYNDVQPIKGGKFVLVKTQAGGKMGTNAGDKIGYVSDNLFEFFAD